MRILALDAALACCSVALVEDGTVIASRTVASSRGQQALLAPMLETWGELPLDLLQSLFTQVDPLLALRKFSRFGRLDGNSPQAANFVALEDWLNDGVPLPAAVARDCLAGWYGRKTRRGFYDYSGAEPVPTR